MHRIVALMAAAASLVTAPVLAGSYAFVDVGIVRPEVDRTDAGMTVIVVDGRIRTVGPAGQVDVPETAEVLASGGFVMAGLAEMHAHVPVGDADDAYLNDVLFLWLANGITTLRGMNGKPAHLALRARLASGETLGPRLYTAGPPIIGKAVKSPEQAASMVREQKQAGYDFIKVHMGISREIYAAAAATANAEQLPFAGHVAGGVGLSRAFEAGQASIDHLDSYLPALAADSAADDIAYGFLGAPWTPYVDAGKYRALAEATRAHGVWNVPTLSMAEKFVGPWDAAAPPAGLAYLPPRMVKGWVLAARGLQRANFADRDLAQRFLEVRLRMVKALHDAGAGLLLGSDAPQILNVPGFSIHDELRLLVAAGLSPAEALATGTVNPARFFGRSDRFGRVAAGLEADLVVTREDPLESLDTLRQPMGVMLRGVWVSADEIETRLAGIEAKYAQ